MADDRVEVELRAVSKSYASRRGAVPALDGLTFDIRRGQFVSLLGPSGCGKSTLLRIVAGLIRPSSGEVRVQGRQVDQPQTQVGLVFQSPVLLGWRTAMKNVLLQAEARGLDRREAESRALELLDSVGLADFAHKRPHELSGGMQQRVAICRALLHSPQLILMDEPFGALDALTRDQLGLDLERLWEQEPRTMLFVTHSLAEAVFLSDRVLVMSARPGQVILDLPIDLPRPRRLAMRDEPRFVDLSRRLREALASTGALRERP